jgi:hypothetical protein
MLRRVTLVRTDVSEKHRLHNQGDKNQRARNNISNNQQPKHAKQDKSEFCFQGEVSNKTNLQFWLPGSRRNAVTSLRESG